MTNPCSICCEEIDLSKNVIILDCGHQFHCACAFRSMSYNKQCPNCRADINYEVSSDEMAGRIERLEEEKRLLLNEAALLMENNREKDVYIQTLKVSSELQKEQFRLEKAMFIDEKRKLREELKKSQADYNRVFLDRIRLKTKLSEEKNQHEKLRGKLERITTENIQFSDRVDSLLNIVKTKFNMNKNKNKEHRREIRQTQEIDFEEADALIERSRRTRERVDRQLGNRQLGNSSSSPIANRPPFRF